MLAELKLDIALALRNLLRSPGRSGFAATTIAAGIIAYVLAAGFIDWVYVAMRDSVIYAQLGHFQVSKTDYFSKGVADPYRYLIAPQNPAIERIRANSAVAALAPRLAVSGLASRDEQTVGFLAEGVDPVLEKPISQQINIRAGRGLEKRGERSVIVGEGLAQALQAKVGDKIVLLSSTATGGQNAVECEVVGIFATSTKAYDDAYLRMPYQIAQELVRSQGATSYVGILRDTDATDRVVEAITPLAYSAGLDVVPWHAQADFYNKTVSLFSKQVGVLRAIIALIIVLSISNSLSMSVMERTSEIGTCLAVGARRRSILRLFLSEGLALGALSGIIGIILSAGLAVIISRIGIPMPPPPGMAYGYIGEIRFSAGIAFEALLLAIATTLLASFLPAWKAAQMNIVDALRQGR